MEVAAPPATSVPASGSATAEAPSEASAAAAHRRARRNDDGPPAASRVEMRRRRRRPSVEYEEAEGDAAGAKARGAGGEVMPTAAMVEVERGGDGGKSRGCRAREIREVGREINDFDFCFFLFHSHLIFRNYVQ